MTRPKLRAAKFGDIPAIWGMMIEGHERSRYAEFAPISERRSKALLMNAIQRHGGQSEGATFCAVMDNGERLEGFIVGILQPLYQIIDAIEATDLFTYARPGANAATAVRLLKAMHKWASACEGPVIIRQGNTDAITDPEQSGRLFERRGMRRVGFVYEKDVTK